MAQAKPVGFKLSVRIRELGFRDFVAMEYVPSKDAMTALAEVRRMVVG